MWTIYFFLELKVVQSLVSLYFLTPLHSNKAFFEYGDKFSKLISTIWYSKV